MFGVLCVYSGFAVKCPMFVMVDFTSTIRVLSIDCVKVFESFSSGLPYID